MDCVHAFLILFSQYCALITQIDRQDFFCNTSCLIYALCICVIESLQFNSICLTNLTETAAVVQTNECLRTHQRLLHLSHFRPLVGERYRYVEGRVKIRNTGAGKIVSVTCLRYKIAKFQKSRKKNWKKTASVQ